MNYKLSTKIGDKWKTFGSIKTNQYGKEQASFRLKDLEELVSIAKSSGKEWVNLSMFENKEEKKDYNPLPRRQVVDVELNDELMF